MKLTRKEYLNRAEERKDFWLGVVVFVALNTFLFHSSRGCEVQRQ